MEKKIAWLEFKHMAIGLFDKRALDSFEADRATDRALSYSDWKNTVQDYQDAFYRRHTEIRLSYDDGYKDGYNAAIGKIVGLIRGLEKNNDSFECRQIE